MSEMITIPAVLPKSQLGSVALLKGSANDGAMRIGDDLLFASGCVVFRGFRDGEANPQDHLFYGNLYFELYDEPTEALRDDFERLSQFVAGQQNDEAPADVRPALLGNDPECNDSDKPDETISSDDDDGDS